MGEGPRPINVPGELLGAEQALEIDPPYSDEEMEAFDREAYEDERLQSTGFDGTDLEDADEETPLASSEHVNQRTFSIPRLGLHAELPDGLPPTTLVGPKY